MLNNIQIQVDYILNNFSINSPEQLAPLARIISIAEYYGIHVIPSQLKNCFARISIIDDETAVLRYNQDYKNEQLIKFSIAHELGHFILHKSKLTEFKDSKELLTKYYSNKGIEQEADEFASELLMPTNMFIHAVESSKIQYPDFNLVKYLSENFNTSITATAMKLVEYGQYCIALIASEDNKIKWFNRDREFRLFLKNRGSTLGSDSYAYKFFNSGEKNNNVHEVFADNWITNVSQEELIMEHTFFSDHYNYTLTIIWREDDLII